MQARGSLMIEHRLIEQMIAIIKDKLVEVGKTHRIDPFFVDKAVDFIHIYADRTHHGKEEEILFGKLNNKDLSDADRKVMNELIEEHALGRNTTKVLVDATACYRKGNDSALEDISHSLNTLVDFYPVHIAKEDTVFFPASRAYFTEAEDQAMLAEFREFDRKMIHEKYASVIDELK